MRKRSSTGKEDVNQTALRVLKVVTEGYPVEVEAEKNPAAVALGRLGGLKGGKARAEKLVAERRREIARKAALARWKNKK